MIALLGHMTRTRLLIAIGVLVVMVGSAVFVLSDRPIRLTRGRRIGGCG